MWLVRPLTLLLFAIPLTLVWLLQGDEYAKIFWTLFVFRYARFLGHLAGSWIYKPSPMQADPACGRRDVTVILTTINPIGPDFRACIHSILSNRPAVLLVVTVGPRLLKECEAVLQDMLPLSCGTRIGVSAMHKAFKRCQMKHALDIVGTPITIFADDHVFWRSVNFLPSVLAPFEDSRVGVVTTRKRVLRTTPGKWDWLSIVNFIACNYLQRHNWELRASNAIDGGAFVASGRTAIYRTCFLKNTHLLTHFCTEKFFFGQFGGDGLGPNDDNFLTREALKEGWLIRFQDTDDATIETTLGEWPKFRSQLVRWARSTFRSNPVMLRDCKFLHRYTWSFFMVYWAQLVNFALFWDITMIVMLSLSDISRGIDAVYFLIWIAWTKTVTFAYVHSFFKLWALLTFWDCKWSGRNLDEINQEQDGPTPATPWVFINDL